jgi:uncharacterized protein YidB (DUF937 family)
MAGLEDMIEGGLNSVLGKSGDEKIDLPSWATPALMGIIGAIGGKAVGGAAGGGGGLGAVLGGLLGATAGSGGLENLLDKFKGAGANEQAQSWVSTGANQPVDPQTVEKALGADTIQKLATEAGTTTEEVSATLATAIPQVVDKMTPNGEVPDSAALEAAATKVAGATA